MLVKFPVSELGGVFFKSGLKFVEGREAKRPHPVDDIEVVKLPIGGVVGDEVLEGWVGFEDRDIGWGIADNPAAFFLLVPGGKHVGELVVTVPDLGNPLTRRRE